MPGEENLPQTPEESIIERLIRQKQSLKKEIDLEKGQKIEGAKQTTSVDIPTLLERMSYKQIAEQLMPSDARQQALQLEHFLEENVYVFKGGEEGLRQLFGDIPQILTALDNIALYRKLTDKNTGEDLKEREEIAKHTCKLIESQWQERGGQQERLFNECVRRMQKLALLNSGLRRYEENVHTNGSRIAHAFWRACERELLNKGKKNKENFYTQGVLAKPRTSKH